MKSLKESFWNEWKIIYFFLAFLFFIFTIFLIFFQKNHQRWIYLNSHAYELEYKKDYHNALKIWKKLFEKNPHQSIFLINMLHNLLLQEKYLDILKIVEENHSKIENQDTVLLLYKHGLIASQNLNELKLSEKYIHNINNILKIDVYWDRINSRWIYIDEKFTYEKLKRWVDIMYNLLDKELSIYTILKDTETPYYYFNGMISFNKLNFIEKEVYEFVAFNSSTKVNPSELIKKPIDDLGFVWVSLKKIQFKNSKWFEELKKRWYSKDANNILKFLKEVRFLVPINYQNQNYMINLDYENIPLELQKMIIEKLKEIKNPQEIEKLKGVLLYLQSKIALK